MKSLVFALGLGLALGGCGKEQPKKVDDQPKKTTPVPSDMVFNDFVPSGGGGSIQGVKTDGGMLEGGMASAEQPPGDPGAPGAPGEEAQPKLKVLEPGAEPRAVRKYAFTVGRSDKRLVTVKQSAGREGGGPAQEAAFAITVDFTPKLVKPTGTKFELKVLKVDLPGAQGAMKAQAQAQLAPFTGLTGSFDVSPQGELGEVDFKADEKMTGPGAEVIIQSLQQSLELIVPPFPAEPVGVGAKWERKIERKDHGQENSAKHTFTLKEVTPEGGVVVADIEVAVPKHAVQQRGAPPGATQEVKGKGTTTYAFRFDHIASKVDGDMTILQKIELVDPKGQKQSETTVVKLLSKLEPAAGATGATAAPAPKP
ncbi:MAG: hypothetical protein QOI41_5452 [Myxococcales bacterium]|jgi:hypothetical protein|nr:hypothetical protein [Myxococcales bacterium]